MATVTGLTADRIYALMAEKAATSHGVHVPAGGAEGQIVKIVGGVPAWAADATGGGGVTDGDKGDITVSGSGTAWAVDSNAITNAKLADVPTTTIKGRTTAGTGDPEDLTAAQARTVLGLGGAALLNVGTAAGTVAAGDDSRMTNARPPSLPIQEEGSQITALPTSINFVGAGVTASGSGAVTVSVPDVAGVVVQDENIQEGATVTTLDFQGAGIDVTVTGNEAVITVPGGGSGIIIQEDNVQEGTNITTVDFQGAGVDVVVTGSEAVVTVAGGAGISDGDKGDITVSGSGATWTIDSSAITSGKIAAGAVGPTEMADSLANRILGRVTAGTGDVEYLTGTQATALMDQFTSGTKGLVPASGGGTTNFLRADGTFASPAGAGAGDKSLGSFTWYFAPSTAMSDPSAGFFRLNNAVRASVTAAAFNTTSGDSGASGEALSKLQVGDEILFSSLTAYKTSNAWSRYRVTSVANNTTWYQFGLTHIDSGAGAMYGSSDEVYVEFVFSNGAGGGSATGPISVVLDSSIAGEFPTAGQGVNGDFALVRNSGDGNEGAWLVGPKSAGAWPTFGYMLQKGRTGKTQMAGDYTSGVGAAVSLPVHFAMTLGAALPNTAENGWVYVSGTLAADANGVYYNGSSYSNTGIYRGTPGLSAGIAAIHVVSRVQVGALPGTGHAGCGTHIASGGGYWALTNSAGRLMIVAGAYTGNPQVGTPMAQGADGDVAAGDWIIFKREGPYLQAWSINGTTGAIKKAIVALQSGPGDQGGSQYFAMGGSGYFIFNDNGTARLKNGWSMA